MTDPVVCADGFTYERSAIALWLRRKSVSPMTRQRVSARLHPNHALRQMIEERRSGATVPASAVQPSVFVCPGGYMEEEEQSAAVAGCRRLRHLLDTVAKVRWRCELLWWLGLRRATRALGWPRFLQPREKGRDGGQLGHLYMIFQPFVSHLGVCAFPYVYTAFHWAGILTFHSQVNVRTLLHTATSGCKLAVRCVRTLFALQ
jgi:hypothetical protein